MLHDFFLLYRYHNDLNKVEENHEAYTSENKLNISKNAKKDLIQHIEDDE